MSIKLKDTANITATSSSSATSATKLQTARSINGTNFDGTGNITTANWGSARTLTIGNTGKSVNGSANVAWTLNEIGAAAASHTHSYLPLNGGSVTGRVNVGGRCILPPVYNYDKGTLINICAAAGQTMVTIHVTGNSYGAGLPINSMYHFYDYTQDGGILSASGVHNGYNIGNMTVYRNNGRLYAWIKQPASYQTFNIEIIANKTLDASISNAAVHTSGNTNTITITPSVASMNGHTHNYAGSSSAGGAANSANTLATARTINGTSFNGSANITTANWGTARNIYIASSDGSGASSAVSVNGSGNATLKLPATIKATLSGNASTATTSNYLASNSRMDYNWNGMNYFNIDGKAGNAAKANDTPTSAWWHVMRFNHANSNGYYTDLAIPFNATSLYYKRITNGAVQNNGWVKVLDSLNYNEYAPTKTGGGASGTWGISVSGNATTATKATQDSAGQQINKTYIKGLSVSGKTITYTKGDGTTGTITTQDTNTTYSTGTASALGLTKLYTGTGTATDGTMTQNAINTALNGKANSSHTHNSITNQDTRNVNTTPTQMPLGLSVHLKSNSTDGLNDGGTYHSTLMIKGWNDVSGGPWAQMAVTANNNLYFRSSNNDTWNAWKKVSLDGHTHNYAAASHTHNYAGSSSAGGNANAAVKLATARTINGTNFDGTGNITTANWGTARNITIGSTTKSVNGSGNVSWSLSDIGAATSSSVGTLSSLKTSAKGNLVAAINEVFQSADSARSSLVSAIGSPLTSTDTLASIATKLQSKKQELGTAAAKVVSGVSSSTNLNTIVSTLNGYKPYVGKAHTVYVDFNGGKTVYIQPQTTNGSTTIKQGSVWMAMIKDVNAKRDYCLCTSASYGFPSQTKDANNAVSLEIDGNGRVILYCKLYTYKLYRIMICSINPTYSEIDETEDSSYYYVVKTLEEKDEEEEGRKDEESNC